ncbi:hypothetical protein FJY71_00760 [candidate division WOR-3 bacterium]|nr:hypothetical protein [candidate division WOR-3 bacterium]
MTDRRGLRDFLFLPERIHRQHPVWVPPIYVDEWQFFNPKKNRAFSYCDTTLLLARQGKEPVGRVMGIVNRRHNEASGERTGRFGFLECYEDAPVGRALLAAVEDWCRARGMDRIVGPMGFTDMDPEGYLVEGFDEEPTLSTYCNFPYLVSFIEQAGYEKEVDYVIYGIPVGRTLPAVYEKVAARVARQREFRLLELRRRRELRPYIRKVFALMNRTFGDLYGYVQLDEVEMDELAARYMPVVDPRFIKVVLRGDEVVAFVIAMPNMNEGIRRCRGRLLPFGILQVLAAARRSKQLDLFLGAIAPDCRGRGLDVMLGAAMLRAAAAAGFTQMDSHHEMESNLRVRAEMERAGGRVIKRQRIFRKAL